MTHVSGVINRINQTPRGEYAQFYFTLDGVHAGYVFELNTSSVTKMEVVNLLLTKPGDQVDFNFQYEPGYGHKISKFTNAALVQHEMATPDKIKENARDSLGL